MLLPLYCNIQKDLNDNVTVQLLLFRKLKNYELRDKFYREHYNVSFPIAQSNQFF